jgi:hypothetical protein
MRYNKERLFFLADYAASPLRPLRAEGIPAGQKLCGLCVKTLGHLSPEKFRKILTQRNLRPAQSQIRFNKSIN